MPERIRIEQGLPSEARGVVSSVREDGTLKVSWYGVLDVDDTFVRTEWVRKDENALHARSIAPRLHDPIQVEVKDGWIVLTWKIAGKKLVGKDSQVMHRCNVTLPNQEKQLEVMLILEAQPVGEQRGAKSFAKCKTGVVSIKCLDTPLGESARLTSRIGIKSGLYADSPSRGPVTHEFGAGALCRLGGSNEHWNLQDAIDEDPRIAVVQVEMQFSSCEHVRDNRAAGGA